MAMGTEEDTGSEEEEIWGMLAGSADDQRVQPADGAGSGVSGAAPAPVPAPAPTQVISGPAAPARSECECESECKPCRPGPGPGPGSDSAALEPPCPNAAAAVEVTQSAPLRQPPGFRVPRPGRIPEALLADPELNAAIAEVLPPTHDFEVHRTIWRLRGYGARHVGLQLPEGLQQWAMGLADIIRLFVPSVESTTILGDVTFGACCIDDLGARALGVDFLIHYGHSCIVPTDQTTVMTLYVHVEVEVDVDHLVETICHNFSPQKKIALMGSVQFKTGMAEAAKRLRQEHCEEKGNMAVPQVKPLGLGETLGCTSPVLGDVDAVVFVCDGRFHLESAMIQNPHVPDGFFRYDPALRTLTREGFAHGQMHDIRRAAIEAAKSAQLVGLILGTLGRQGSSGVLEEVERLLEHRGVEHFTLLLSEISPERLALMPEVGAWVQVACPRLSLDWGEAYAAPLLTPYEAHVAFGKQAYKDVYPMDYYSNRGGPWSNYGAHNGHGGSLGRKFRHLGSHSQRRSEIEYEETGA